MKGNKDLYAYVTKNDKYGFYELKKEYRKKMEDFYKNEYYQSDCGLYQHDEYDAIDIAHKKNFYSQKMYVINKWEERNKNANNFLDIGCGEGFALDYFYNAGWNVTGIDYSSYGIEGHNPSMKKFLLQGDFYEIINDLNSKKKYFDFINADNVLEHLPDPELFFKIVKKVSHEKTILCVTVPNDFSLMQKLAYTNGYVDDAFWVSKENSEHFNYFSVDSLRKLGNSAGYEELLATSDWPIDFFLLHSVTNYKKDKSIGHDCHVACALLENSICAESMENAVNLFCALAKAGIGREISLYFSQNKKTKEVDKV